MAKLTDIASHHNVKIDVMTPTSSVNNSSKIVEDHKSNLRRAWIETTNNETVFKPRLDPIQTRLIHPVETESKQSLNTEETKSSTLFKQGLNGVEDLRGNPFKVMSFLARSASSQNPYITEKISVTDISQAAEISRESVKTALKFLIKNQIIIRIKSYTGLHGWTIYQLDKSLVDDFIKRGLNRVKTGGISSSSNKITTTNYNITKSEDHFLNNSWSLIDFSSLLDIGFGEQQLNQLAKSGKLSPEEVQNSIDAFAFARTKNDLTKSIRGDHLNYFMGIVSKKGEPYLPPAGYESPKERALKNEKERISRELALDAEVKELKFQAWYNNLAKEDKDKLIEQELTPEIKEVFFGSGARHMPEHVKENKRKEVLKPYFLNVLM